MRLSQFSKPLIQGVLPAALMVVLAFPAEIFSEAAEPDHVVSSQALQQQLETSSAVRQQQIKTVTGFLSLPGAERAMKDAHIDPVRVKTAVPTLTDQELASLATRATDAQQKFAAGGLTTDELLIVILIVAIVVIVVALR